MKPCRFKKGDLVYNLYEEPSEAAVFEVVATDYDELDGRWHVDMRVVMLWNREDANQMSRLGPDGWEEADPVKIGDDWDGPTANFVHMPEMIFLARIAAGEPSLL